MRQDVAVVVDEEGVAVSSQLRGEQKIFKAFILEIK